MLDGTGAPCRVFFAALGGGLDDDERAATLSAILAPLKIDAVYASGEPRATRVATVVAAPTEAPLIVDPRLHAADDLGSAAVALFCELVRVRQNGTIVIVCERRVVQVLLSFVMEAGAENAHRFDVAELSLTAVEAGRDGHGVLRALNADRNAAPAAPGSSKVYLIRHGHAMSVEKGGPAYSHHPIPLSPHGREQAARVGAALQSGAVAALYSSDLVRARETSQIIGGAIGLDVVVDETLRELALGDFEGMTLERVHAEHPRFVPWLEITFRERFPTRDFHHPAELSFPNGQSVLEVHERALATFLRIVRANRGHTVAIVSHGWILQPLLCHIVGASPNLYYRFSLPTATLSLAAVGDDGRGELEIFNGAVGLTELPKLAAS